MSVAIIQADAGNLPLKDRCADIVFGSPPYCDARTYGIGAVRGCVEWVTWMLAVTDEAMRCSRGPVLWVAAGVTRDRNYWPACEGLMWEWWKRGGDCQLYRPCVFHRLGIPGSGGDQWFRSDWEFVMCFKRPGRLPWTNNTACGHPPKWAPGGEMSHRLSDGARVNQWGHSFDSGGTKMNSKEKIVRDRPRPSHRQHTKRRSDGSMEEQDYAPPAIANPGNVIHCNVGGGHMGHPIAHENEAPMPEKLAEFFVLSLCPPGGTVMDPFSGSGTTAAVAQRHGRHAIAADIRWSETSLTRRRLQNNQLSLLSAEDSHAP